MTKNSYLQNVIRNSYPASPKPTAHICLTETTEVTEDEKFETRLTRNYTFTKKQPAPFIAGSIFVWRGLERS